MNKFWKLQCYEDLSFFKKLIYKFRLAKQLKKMCKFQLFMENNKRFEDMDFSDYLEYLQIGTVKDVCKK